MTSALTTFDDLRITISEKLAYATGIVVTSDDDKERALDAGRQLKRFEKSIEDRRKSLVGPMNDEVKRINASAKELLDPVAKATAHLKDELIRWECILEEQRKREQARIEV